MVTLPPVGNRQDLPEFRDRVDFVGEHLDIQRIPRLHPVLLAARFEYCVVHLILEIHTTGAHPGCQLPVIQKGAAYVGAYLWHYNGTESHD